MKETINTISLVLIALSMVLGLLVQYHAMKVTDQVAELQEKALNTIHSLAPDFEEKEESTPPAPVPPPSDGPNVPNNNNEVLFKSCSIDC